MLSSQTPVPSCIGRPCLFNQELETQPAILPGKSFSEICVLCLVWVVPELRALMHRRQIWPSKRLTWTSTLFPKGKTPSPCCPTMKSNPIPLPKMCSNAGKLMTQKIADAPVPDPLRLPWKQKTKKPGHQGFSGSCPARAPLEAGLQGSGRRPCKHNRYIGS